MNNHLCAKNENLYEMDLEEGKVLYSHGTMHYVPPATSTHKGLNYDDVRGRPARCFKIIRGCDNLCSDYCSLSCMLGTLLGVSIGVSVTVIVYAIVSVSMTT